MKNRIKNLLKAENIKSMGEITVEDFEVLCKILAKNASEAELDTFFAFCNKDGDDYDLTEIIQYIFKDHRAKGTSIKTVPYYTCVPYYATPPYCEAELKEFLRNSYFEDLRIPIIKDLYEKDIETVGSLVKLDFRLLFDIVDTYREEWLVRGTVHKPCPHCHGQDDDCTFCFIKSKQYYALSYVMDIVVDLETKKMLPNHPVIEELFEFFAKNYPEDLAFSYLDKQGIEGLCAYTNRQKPNVQKRIMEGFETSEENEAYMYCYYPKLFDRYLTGMNVNEDLKLVMLQSGSLPRDYLAKFWFDTALIDEYAEVLGVQVLVNDFIEFLEEGVYEYNDYYNVEADAHDLITYAADICEPVPAGQQAKIFWLLDDWLEEADKRETSKGFAIMLSLGFFN